MNDIKIPFGLGTYLGSSTSITAFALAVVAFLTGDRSEKTLGVLAAAGVGAVILAVTLGGRFLQAHANIKAAAVGASVSNTLLAELEAHRNALVDKLAELEAKIPPPAPAAPAQTEVEVDELLDDDEPPELRSIAPAGRPAPDVGDGDAAPGFGHAPVEAAAVAAPAAPDGLPASPAPTTPSAA